MILAANHRSFLDSIFLPLVVGRRVTFVAKAEYFDDPKTAWFFRGVGQIPIRREGGSASEGALAAATDVLEHGGVFGIYPEGTRTRDGYTHRGHTGVARLALRTGAPIVPVGLIGTDECQPIDKKLPAPVPHACTMRFGAPIARRALRRQTTSGIALRAAHRRADVRDRAAVRRYEYRDTYATKQAEDVPTEPPRVDLAASASTPPAAGPDATVARPARRPVRSCAPARTTSRSSSRRPASARSTPRRHARGGRRRRRHGRARTPRPPATRAAASPGVAHTPSAMPARYAAPSAVVSCTTGSPHRSRRARRPGTGTAGPSRSRRRRRAARRSARRDAAVIASTTSRGLPRHRLDDGAREVRRGRCRG